MSVEGTLRYVKWEECTKRDQELMGIKSDPLWKADCNGVIKESKVQEVLKADYNTDLKLRYALQRRSIAFDQARLLDYELFERWTQVLLEAYMSPPLEGYAKVNLEQVHRADMELFKYMMRETRNGIRGIGGHMPLENALKEAMKSPEVRLCLQPLQGGTKRKAHEIEDEVTNKTKKKDEESYKKTIENLQNQIKNMQASKGKGKGKGKGKMKMIRMPSSLIGMSPTTSSGDPMCYDFNLNGCSKAKKGERCSKGWHLCMRPNCGQAHSQKEHDSS